MEISEPDEDRRVPSNQDVIDSVTGALDEMQRQMEVHNEEKHLDFDQAGIQRMVDEHNGMLALGKKNGDTLDRVEGLMISMTDTIHGEPTKDIDGMIHRSGGLEERVETLENQPAPATTLSPGDRVTLYVAAISGLAAVVVAVISVAG